MEVDRSTSTTSRSAACCPPTPSGILNAPVCDFIWRRIARPFQNGYFAANKQYIAPLPIPEADAALHRRVSEGALALQRLHSERRDLLAKFDRRLASGQTEPWTLSEEWLWADVGSFDDWRARAPADLGRAARTAWAKARREERLAERLERIDARLQPGARLRVENDDDELRLLLDGQVVLELFDKPDTPLIAAQWRCALRQVRVTQAFGALKLIRSLLRLRRTRDADLAARLVALERDVSVVEARIAGAEGALNAVVYQLYSLSEAEIAMVEAER
jgi:hypothetical protein